jgi:hypothetical protein
VALISSSALIIQVAGASSSGASRQANQQVLNGEFLPRVETCAYILDSNPHLHGWSCSTAVLHSSVPFLRHQIPPNDTSSHSTKRRRSVKCIAIVVRAIRSTITHHGRLFYSVQSKGTNVIMKIRIIFRLVEYSHGFKSNIPDHEAYQYGLDSVPMLLALIVLNLVHPGRIMPGKGSDLPSRKERRVQGIYNKSRNISEQSSSAA